MQRLLADATKLTGVKYDINNLSDVYNAIHAVQGKLEITGTTAKEASTTLTGSFSAMGAAFQDFLGNLAIGADLTAPMQALAETVSTFLFNNFIPMVINIFKGLPGAIVAFLQTAVPLFIEQGTALLQSIMTGVTTAFPLLMEQGTALIQSVLDWLTTSFPAMIDRGSGMITNLVTGIMQALPVVITSVGTVCASIIEFFLKNLPAYVEQGYKLIGKLAKGILDNLPAIILAIGQIIQKLIGVLMENMPTMIHKGFELIGRLANGLLNNLPAVKTSIGNILRALVKIIVDAVPKLLKLGLQLIGSLAKGLIGAIGGVISNSDQIVDKIKSVFGDAVNGMIGIGANLIKGLWRGIGSVKDWIFNKIGGFASGIVGKIKGFFGIHSPSKVFAEIGQYLDLGLAKGIMDSTRPVDRAMRELEETASRDFTSTFSAKVAGDTSLTEGSLSGGASSTAQPVRLVLDLNGHFFEKLVDDITAYQDKTIRLNLAY